jgi:plasmid maintenance system antidote protein VapI
MEDRLNKLMSHFKITPAQLADSIGVQRSSISHILSGRNKPSYDFLIKILKKYNDISAEWLLLNEGNMLRKGSIYSQPPQKNADLNLFSTTEKIPYKTKDYEGIVHRETQKDDSKKTKIGQEREQTETKIDEFTNVNYVKQIVFIYSDNTFTIINKQ